MMIARDSKDQERSLIGQFPCSPPPTTAPEVEVSGKGDR